MRTELISVGSELLTGKINKDNAYLGERFQDIGLPLFLEITVPDELMEAALRLDKLYITTRYPNGFEKGSPGDFYTSSEAQEAIRYAEGILHFCEGYIS